MYNPFNPGYGYPQMMPQFNGMRQQAYNQPQFVVRQVTSIEEARASIIDPLSTFLFIDTSTGYIYVKRMNNNGLSDFYTYKAEETSGSKTDPLEAINQRLGNIEKLIGGNYVQSVSGNAVSAESQSDDYEPVTEPEPTVVQQGSTNGKWQNRGRN